MAVARVDKVARLERLLDDLDGSGAADPAFLRQLRLLLRELGAL